MNDSDQVEITLKALLRVKPSIEIHYEDTLGTFIKIPVWLMALDESISPYSDLIDYLAEHSTILDDLANLNDLRQKTVGDVIASILSFEK